MSKSSPTSIRFDDDDLRICLLHSKKKTKQELVDWFCKNEFVPNSNKQVFCTTNCRVYYNRKKDKVINGGIVIPKDIVLSLKYLAKVESTQDIVNFLINFWLDGRIINLNEKESVKENIPQNNKHRLYRKNDPPENTNAFGLKYDCNTYDELEVMVANKK